MPYLKGCERMWFQWRGHREEASVRPHVLHQVSCVHVYVSTCLHVYMSTFIHVYSCTRTHVYMSACLPVYLSARPQHVSDTRSWAFLCKSERRGTNTFTVSAKIYACSNRESFPDDGEAHGGKKGMACVYHDIERRAAHCARGCWRPAALCSGGWRLLLPCHQDHGPRGAELCRPVSCLTDGPMKLPWRQSLRTL